MAITLWGNLKDWVFRKKKPDELQVVAAPEWTAFQGLMKSWADPAYTISAQAYDTARRNDVVVQPMTKFAQRIGSMALTVVGVGKRRDELQKIIDQAVGVSDALEWLAWARIEGVRFLSHYAKRDEQTGYAIPDFRSCGAMKWKAGGVMYWEGLAQDRLDPKKSIGKVPETVAVSGDPKEEMQRNGSWFDRADWTVFRPGAGTNPEGELETMLQVFLIAESAQLLDKSMRLYSDRYGLPRELLRKIVDSVRPDELGTVLTNAGVKLARSNARTRMPMNAQDALELLEPKGTTWGFLTEYRSLLERRVHKLITGEDISSGAKDAGDRGGHETSDKQLNSASVAWGKKIADALSTDWLPWLEKQNEGVLPRLRADEPKPYLALRPPVEKQRISIAELVQVYDRDIELASDFVYEVIGTDKPEGVGDTLKNSRDGVLAAQQKAAEQKMAADAADPADNELPSNSGDSTQRKDRKQEDSNISPDQTRKQKPEEDLRNMK